MDLYGGWKPKSSLIKLSQRLQVHWMCFPSEFWFHVVSMTTLKTQYETALTWSLSPEIMHVYCSSPLCDSVLREILLRSGCCMCHHTAKQEIITLQKILENDFLQIPIQQFPTHCGVKWELKIWGGYQQESDEPNNLTLRVFFKEKREYLSISCNWTLWRVCQHHLGKFEQANTFWQNVDDSPYMRDACWIIEEGITSHILVRESHTDGDITCYVSKAYLGFPDFDFVVYLSQNVDPANPCSIRVEIIYSIRLCQQVTLLK